MTLFAVKFDWVLSSFLIIFVLNLMVVFPDFDRSLQSLVCDKIERVHLIRNVSAPISCVHILPYNLIFSARGQVSVQLHGRKTGLIKISKSNESWMVRFLNISIGSVLKNGPPIENRKSLFCKHCTFLLH